MFSRNEILIYIPQVKFRTFSQYDYSLKRWAEEIAPIEIDCA